MKYMLRYLTPHRTRLLTTMAIKFFASMMDLVIPFLLARIKEITGGESLASNIALVYNNVELAAKIAANL